MSIFSKFMSFFQGKLLYIGGNGTRSRPKSYEIEDSAICNSILDCNATHIARGRVLHVIENRDGQIKEVKRNSQYTKVFNNPNNMMTRQDFLYCMAWQLQVNNIAFAWIKWDIAIKPVEIWPLVFLNFEICERTDGGLAVKFHDPDGIQRVVRVEDLIIVRRKFDGTGFSSRDNHEITETLSVMADINESLKQASRISNRINGILKQKKSMLNLESTKTTQSDVGHRLEDAADQGGVFVLDAMEEYQALDIKTWAANATHMQEIKKNIHAYWRTPEEVVANTASEQIMQNYYDAIVEPIWEELSDAFTKSLFTRREQDFGNKIVISSGVATGASWQTKLKIISDTKELGLLMKNEYRELLGYPPTDDGDVFLVSLNFVKSTDQSKYQTGQEGGKKDGDKNREDTSED